MQSTHTVAVPFRPTPVGILVRTAPPTCHTVLRLLPSRRPRGSALAACAQLRNQILQNLKHVRPVGAEFCERPPDAMPSDAVKAGAAAAAAEEGGRRRAGSGSGEEGRDAMDVDAAAMDVRVDAAV